MKLLKSLAYIRFLHHLDTSDQVNTNYDLDSKEEKLLNHIALASVQGSQLLVGDLISLSQLGSQATLHGRIKNLAAIGLIKLTEDKLDGRKKFVTLTTKAVHHFERLSVCLEKGLKI